MRHTDVPAYFFVVSVSSMNLTKLLGVVILGGLAFAHKKDWVLRWIALTVIANGILCHGISTPTLVNCDIF
jgi:hypothetical protein